MKTKLVFILLAFLLLIISCTSMKKVNDTSTWDYEKYMNEAQKSANKARYQRSIDLLKEASIKYSNSADEIISLNYNIGYYYYAMKKYEDAIGYFNTVIKMYETRDYSEAQKVENKKFVILSTTVMSKIKKDKEDLKDPYHVKEDMENMKKIQAKKDTKKVRLKKKGDLTDDINK